jgi:hypothetical protein
MRLRSGYFVPSRRHCLARAWVSPSQRVWFGNFLAGGFLAMKVAAHVHKRYRHACLLMQAGRWWGPSIACTCGTAARKMHEALEGYAEES